MKLNKKNMKKLSTKVTLNNKATPAIAGGNGYDINTGDPIVRPTTFITDKYHCPPQEW